MYVYHAVVMVTYDYQTVLVIFHGVFADVDIFLAIERDTFIVLQIIVVLIYDHVPISSHGTGMDFSTMGATHRKITEHSTGYFILIITIATVLTSYHGVLSTCSTSFAHVYHS